MNTTNKAVTDSRTVAGKKFDVEQFLWAQADKASAQWFKSQSLDNYAQIYLYYRSGELAAFEDGKVPDGWTLGLQSRLSPSHTRDYIKRQIAEVARRLPFLPIEA